MTKRSLKINTLILMAAGFGVKMIGFFYRVVLARYIQAEGMGLYQLIIPIYSLLVLTLSSGISIAVSRLTAKECSFGNETNSKRITIVSFMLILIVGSVFCGTSFIFLNKIAIYIIGDVRTIPALKVMIPFVPLIAASSAIRGYFYGKQDVMPNAIAQILEQTAKMIFIIIIIKKYSNISIEKLCSFAVISLVVGELVNLLFVIIIFYSKTKKIKHVKNQKLIRKRSIVVNVLRISIPVSANRFTVSTLGAFENVLIPARLILFGMTEQESIIQYGRLAGMAFPLIFFPTMVTGAMATTLVPAVTEAISKNNYTTLNYRISKAIQFSIAIGISVSAIFLTFSNSIGELIFKGQGIGEILYYLGYTCTFIYLQQTLTGIMNGLGKQSLSLVNTIISDAVRIGFVFFLIPLWGLKAYYLGIIIGCIIISLLDTIAITKITSLKFNLIEWIAKPLICAIFIILAGYVLDKSGNMTMMIIAVIFYISVMGTTLFREQFIKLRKIIK